MTSEKRNSSPQATYIVAGVGLIIAVGLLFVAYNVLNKPPDVEADRLNQEAALGTSNARVEVIEYGAYGCFNCRTVHNSGVLDQILEQYDGDVRLVFRNWPVINARIDPIAAEAAQCALDQSEAAFWTLHNAIYDLPIRVYQQMNSIDHYVDLANEKALDGSTLRACMEASTHQRTVQHWKDHGDGRGLRGTPTFFVNGQLVVNPSDLVRVIEEALAS